MEFFRIVDVKTTEQSLREALSLEQIEKMSTQLISLGEPDGRELFIGTVWGEFTLSRDEIRGGLRFALVECPNALAWTVTTGFQPAPENIVIHMTINRTRKGPQLLEGIEEFLEDMEQSLHIIFSNSEKQTVV